MRPKYRYSNTQTDMLLGMKNIEARALDLYDDYLKRRQEEGLSGEPISLNRFREIAPKFDEELNVINTRYGNVTTFRGVGDAKVDPMYVEDTQRMKSTYERLIKNSNFFEKIVDPKKQSGLQLMNKTIALDTNFTKIRGVSSINRLYDTARSINNVINGASGFFAAFDMETLSGKNAYGYDDLFGVTEYAFNIYGAGGELQDTISNVIGLTDEKYTELLDRLTLLKGKSNADWSELDKVIIDRLNFYNNADIENVPGQFRRRITKSKALEDINSTLDGAIAGLEKLGKLSNDQAAVLHSDFANIAAGMANGGSVNIGSKKYGINAVTGHNTRAFDITKFNRASKMYNTSAYIDELNTNNFDLLQAIKYIYAKHGGNYYGGIDDIAAPRGKGLMTLEYLKAMYPDSDISDLAAHTAFEDTNTSARMLMANIKRGSGSTTLLQDIIDKLDGIRPETQSKFIGGNKQLYRVDQATSFSNYNRSGAIGFTHDKFSNTFKTFNGYEISGDSVTKAHMNQSGLKAGALYSFDMRAFETNEDFINAFGTGADQMISEFNTGRIYALAGTPVFDTNTPHSIGARQDVYYVTNNLNDIESMLNNMQQVGELVANGTDIDYSDAKNYRALAGISQDPNLALSIVNGEMNELASNLNDGALLDEYVGLSTERLTNEYAANYIRDMDFDRYKKFKNVISDITTIYKGELSSNASSSEKIAYAISKGATVGGFNNLGGAFDALTFNSPSTGKDELLTNSINRMTWASKNMDSLMPIFDEITNMVSSAIPGNDDASKLKRNEAFKSAFRDIMETMSNDKMLGTAEGIQQARNMAFESDPTKLTKGELDYIELTGRQLYGTIGDDSLHQIRIGDNRLDDNLLSKLFKKEHGGRLGANIDGTAGKQSLIDFINRMNNDPVYKDVFKGVDKARSPKEISADIMTRLNGFIGRQREKDPIFGIVDRNINTQFANRSSSRAAAIAGNMSQVKNIVRNAIDNAQNYVMVDRTKVNQTAVDQLVKRMMTVSADDINNLNLDSHAKRTLLGNYNLAKSDIENIAKDLLGAISGSDLQLSFNEQSDTFGEVLISKKGQDAMTRTLPVLRMKNGTLFVDLESTSHVLRPAINEKALNKGQIEYVSQIGAVFNRGGSFSAFVKSAQKKGTDELKSFASAFSSLNQGIREGMPAIQIFNPQAFTMQLEAYTSDITGYLDKLSVNGKPNGLPGYDSLSPEEKKSIDSIFKKIEKNPKSRRNVAWEKLSPSERSIFDNKIFNPLMSKYYPSPNQNISDSDWIIQNLMFGGKSTHIADSGTASIGRPVPDIMTLFDSQSRDNPTQFSNMYYHRKANLTEKALKSTPLEGKVSIDSLMTDARKEFTVFNAANEIGTEMTGMITGKFASMDTGSVKRIIVKAGSVEVVGDSNPFVIQAKIVLGKTGKYKNYDPLTRAHIDKVAKEIKERTLHGSTYMQETILYSRVAESVFNKAQRQVINDTTTLMANYTSDVDTIEKLQFSMNKGQFKYGQGFEVDENGNIFAQKGYADSRKAYGSKSTGIIRGAFFDKYGDAITESEIQDALKKSSVGSFNDVEGYLKSKYGFDFKYYVDPYTVKDGVKFSLSRTEKSVSYGLISQLGAYNPEIVNRLKGTRFERFIGSYATETLLDEIENTPGLQGIKEMALREKHAVGDTLFGKEGIFGKTNIIAITNQDVPKHAGVSVALASAIGRLKEENKLTNENIGKIINGATIKNGKVVIPEYSKFQDMFINVNALNDILGDGSVYSTANIWGENINVGYAEFSQVLDWQGGTSQGDDISGANTQYLDNLRGQLGNLYNQRAEALSSGKDTSKIDASIISIEKLMQQKRDEMATSGFIHRGFVYSDRMHDLLGARVLNDDYVRNLTEKGDAVVTGALKDFVDGNNVLKAEFKGQRVLSPLTDLYKNNIFSDGTKLVDVDPSDPRTWKAYGHVKEFFKDSLGKDVSAQWADQAYSVSTTAEALRFNEAIQQGKAINPEGYGKRYGYAIRGFDQFEPQIGAMLEAQKLDPNSAYFNNSIFDLGEEFGSKRYLAMGRPSYQNTGNSLTVPDHMKMLNSLKSQYETWASDKTIDNQQRVYDALDDIVKQQSVDFGNMQRELTQTRLDRSFTAKAAGLTIYRGTADEAYDSLSSTDRYKLLKKYNGVSALTNATFEGKNYLQHYSEGRYLDAVLLSEKAFEDMGYFSDESLKKYGAKTRAEMVDMLSSKGDVHLLGRFPMIREGSATAAWAILDKSLVGNEARVFGPSQAAMNADFDGDTLHVHALMNKRRETYMQNQVRGMGYDDLHSRLRMNLLSRSVSENRYYEEVVQDQLRSEAKIAMNSGKFMEVAKKAIYDGERIFANLATPNNKDIMSAYHAMNVLKEQQNLASDDELLNYITENNLGDSTRMQYAMYKAQGNLALEAAAKTQKSVIGEANTINFKMRKAFSTFIDPNIEDYNVRREMFNDTVEIFEQKVISAKNAKDITNLQKSEQWKAAINNIIAGREVYESKQKIGELFDESIVKDLIENGESGRFKKYIESFPTFRDADITMDNFAETVKGSFLDTMDLFRNNRQVQDFMRTTAHFGEDKFGTNTFVFDNIELLSSDPSIQTAAAKRLSAAGVLNNANEITTELLSYSKKSGTYLADGREWLKDEESAGQKAKSILKSTGEIFEKIIKGVDGKTLAMGALGLAGAYMVAGFVGGNPSKPAETQAMEDSQSGYHMPSLLDQNLQYAQGQQQGYVINVNAKTARGKQYTTDVINNAVSRSFNTNVNIAMNITDDNGNINDRYIEQLLAGAVR